VVEGLGPDIEIVIAINYDTRNRAAIPLALARFPSYFIGNVAERARFEGSI
jgi:hypothetical protein